MRVRLGSLAAAAAGVAAWAIPLVISSGGLSNYLNSLGSQAGEDFSGVVMLWTNRTPKVAALALLNTFVLPWDHAFLAGVVLALAAAGLFVLLLTTADGRPVLMGDGWRRAALLAVMFGPYAIFHLLFQETVTVRYALPLVLPIAYLVAVSLTETRPVLSLVVGSALVASMLWLAVPAGSAYGRIPSPIFRVLDAMSGSPNPAAIVGMHRRVWTESRRARKWRGEPPGELLPAPRDYEWLELTRAWRARDVPVTWFVADPRRTDLALIDPGSRQLVSYRWPFRQRTYVGGARPDEVDLVTIGKPGWFLEQGWALTPEVAGVTGRDGGGPHKRPSVGWVRSRTGEGVMMIGGRHLGGAADPPVRVHVALEGRPILSFAVTPGYFLRFEPLAAGMLAASAPFAKLTVTADTESGGAVPAVAIEQFDLQAPDVLELGFDDGWLEPEYNPQTGRSWRWMTERAVLAVRGGTRDVTLRIAGESTRRYFPRASRLTVSVAGETVSVLEPSQRFRLRRPGAARSSRQSERSDRLDIRSDVRSGGSGRHCGPSPPRRSDILRRDIAKLIDRGAGLRPVRWGWR